MALDLDLDRECDRDRELSEFVPESSSLTDLDLDLDLLLLLLPVLDLPPPVAPIKPAALVFLPLLLLPPTLADMGREMTRPTEEETFGRCKELPGRDGEALPRCPLSLTDDKAGCC